MGIRLTVEFGLKCAEKRGDKYDIFICHRPLGKHSVACGSRGVKRRDNKEIMGKAKGKNNMGIKIYTL